MSILIVEDKTLNELDLKSLSENIIDDEHKSYFLSESSKEHYRLLAYISKNTNNSNFLDVGTFKGCSSLSLSYNENNKVFSFDISNSFGLKTKPKNVEYFIDNILNNNYKDLILSCSYILLDTMHDGTFELEFYKHLININYIGILLLDDIKLNGNMISFWDEITHEKYDISNIGHSTGTGVVFFK
jgi:hypothetical protein